MANNYFQFKQFTVQQEHCAMKVCTDACIFGAYAAAYISRQCKAERVLDIGAGTGLLSLMVAQKTNGTIDAVEIDETAFVQARHNFEQSPWKQRLTITNADARLMGLRKKYDCIISNPPFFENSLQSADDKKNAAKHDTSLTLEQLLQLTRLHLSPHGFFAVLLPFHRSRYFIEMALAAQYYLQEQLLVRHTSGHPFFRSILIFSHDEKTAATSELVIKNNDGQYTPEFTALLHDYYLHL